MKIRIVAVGKLKESHWRAAVDDYLARLTRYADVRELEVKEGAAGAMAKAIPDRAHVIALTIDGKARSSEELANDLETIAVRAVELVFLIGGADGIPADALARASARLSLSKMTFPHRLARLILVEQIYRAMTIRKGEPYHH